jgi:putative transposase
MYRTFKYRIYANKEILAKTENWLELCRNLYNCALEQRIDAWKRQRITLFEYAQSAELPLIKQTNLEYKYVNAQTLQEVLERLELAYKKFFKRRVNHEGKGGFPRFKGKNRYDSFTLKNTGWKLDGKYISIRHLGKFKLKLSREIQGDIKTITICKSKTNHWYACFSCDNISEKRLTQSDKIIGIDVGIRSFLTDSEGDKVENPKFLKHTLRELRVRQRALVRNKRNSNRRKETKLQLSKCYEKITNQRKDFHYKLANQYVENYGVISIENLNISGLVKNHKLARDIKDCAWGNFIEILKFKAEEAGRQVIEVNPHNTSKMCSNCGKINTFLKLSDREWACLECGTIHDRDENAAINIKRLGQSRQTLTCQNTESVV